MNHLQLLPQTAKSLQPQPTCLPLQPLPGTPHHSQKLQITSTYTLNLTHSLTHSLARSLAPHPFRLRPGTLYSFQPLQTTSVHSTPPPTTPTHPSFATPKHCWQRPHTVAITHSLYTPLPVTPRHSTPLPVTPRNSITPQLT